MKKNLNLENVHIRLCKSRSFILRSISIFMIHTVQYNYFEKSRKKLYEIEEHSRKSIYTYKKAE